MSRKRLGEELSRLRRATGLAQEEFGRTRLGKSQSYVAKLENGSVGAGIDEIEAWAAATGMEFVWEFKPLGGEQDEDAGDPADGERIRRMSGLLSKLQDPMLSILRAQLDTWIVPTKKDAADDPPDTGRTQRREEESSGPLIAVPPRERRVRT